MAQFDCHLFYGKPVVDIQSDFLTMAGLRTRTIVPLLLLALPAAPRPIRRLNPIVRLDLDGKDYLFQTQNILGGINENTLGWPICSVIKYQDEINAAYDFLRSGI